MTAKYDASQIEVLEGLEAIRRRPAMYLGEVDPHRALILLLRGWLDFNREVTVRVSAARRVVIEMRDGPFIEDAEMFTRIVTTLAQQRDYGLVIACALSEQLIVTMSGFTQQFARGKPASPVEPAGRDLVRIDMTIDPEIFGAVEWDRVRLDELLKACALVFPGTKLKLLEE